VQKLIYKPISTSGWSDYELLDTGNKRKLERFGTLILDRFEPDANWTPSLDAEVWQSAHSKYYPDRTQNAGHWQAKLNKQEEWEINLDSLRVALNLSRSRHIGIFPEQLENWRWLQTKMSNFNKPPRILILFAYTGISSLYCAHAGAEVTHVDASRSAIEIAKKSQTSSDLGSKTIRWIVDDAIKFMMMRSSLPKERSGAETTMMGSSLIPLFLDAAQKVKSGNLRMISKGYWHCLRTCSLMSLIYSS